MSDALTDKRGQTDEKPSMGVHKAGAALVLQEAPNGGWTIQAQSDHSAVMPVMVGAYSNADDMLSALKENLTK